MTDDGLLRALGDGTYRAHWLRQLCRTPRVTDSVRVLLFTMAMEDMDEAGNVSVPREELAARIGRGKSRVSERIHAAVEAGFLVRVAAGKKGRTAEYRAALPEGTGPESADRAIPEMGPDGRTEDERLGSGRADPIKGPDGRTRTSFRSGLQDAESPERVRTGGPNKPVKGPDGGDANSYVEVVVSEDSPASAAEALFDVDRDSSRKGDAGEGGTGSKRTSTTTPPRVDVEQLCDRLLTWLVRKDYRQRPKKVGAEWRNDARLLLDKDGVPLAEALEVLDWSQKDPFWIKNINSMKKFRVQYGQLELKSRGFRGDASMTARQDHGRALPGGRRESTTDARVAQAFELAQRLAGEEASQDRKEIAR